MTVILFEIFRALIVGSVFFFLVFYRKSREIKLDGWNFIVWGFAFLFLGMVIDITDNFPQLKNFIIIGDTIYESFVEKVIGYLLGFLLLAVGIWKWIPGVVEHTLQTVEERDKAMDEVKNLSGLLPICSSCKKIRDDKGYWSQIETYIQEHSDANFTHGICPDCKAKFYSELMNNSAE